MKQKIMRYRTVWILVVALMVAWLSLLRDYHVPGTGRALSRAVQDYIGLQTEGSIETVQQQKIGGSYIVTYRWLDGSGEFGAVRFKRGWNGLWRPVQAVMGETYPLGKVELPGGKGYAVFAVDCPEEAAYWGFVPSGDLYGKAKLDPQNAHPITERSFIAAIEAVPRGSRLGLFDAEGKELPAMLPGWSSYTTETVYPELGFVLLLTICAVGGAVRAIYIRRKKRAGRDDNA